MNKKIIIISLIMIALVFKLDGQHLKISWVKEMQVAGLGHHGDGAGIAFVDLDNNQIPEMVLMAYDNPSGYNKFKYKIGWNANENGYVPDSNWSKFEVSGLGHHGDGAGIAFVDLDNDSKPEMVLMAYDDASGKNNFKYKIGRNLSSNGFFLWPRDNFEEGGFGHAGDGAGIAFVNLDDHSAPEIVLMAYDDSDEGYNFKYKIGWNVSRKGYTTDWDEFEVEGVGKGGDGAGIDFVNLDNNKRPEMILMAHYYSPSGKNKFKYKIGWNVSRKGYATHWDKFEVGGVNRNEDGAGVAFVDLDNDSKPEMVLMAYYAPSGNNSFKYKIGRLEVSSFGSNENWTGGPYFGHLGTFFADVTGDGKADAIVVKCNGVFVRPSDGSRFKMSDKNWTGGPYYGQHGNFFADVTGDGKADAIVVKCDRVVVRPSDGSNFKSNEHWSGVPYYGQFGTFFADVTGDGRADAIVVNCNRVVVRRSDDL